MKNSHQRQTFFVFLIILNIPNFFIVETNTSSLLNFTEFLEKLIICFLLGGGGLTLFSRPWVAWLVIWILSLWWQPLALGVRSVNQTPITATLVGMAAATSPAELRNLFAATSWKWFVFFILWNIACFGVFCWLRYRPNWRWTWKFRAKVCFFCFSILALPYLIGLGSHEKKLTKAEEKSANVPPSPQAPLDAFTDGDRRIGNAIHLPKIFPYELPWSVAQYWKAQRVVEVVRKKMGEPAVAYTLSTTEAFPEVVVLVIGESSTRNAWHWFNAQAPMTTKNLEARVAQGDYLFNFRETLALTTSTRQAVPSMLTAQPLVWPDGAPNPRPTRSIVSVAGQAGYGTAWLSNQAAIGMHDGIIASYAREAAVTVFLNPSDFSAQGSLDEVLLPALSHQLKKNRKIFVVLHTMGSHFHYEYRYPRGFGPFPESKNSREAYFNSVAYTDWFLNQVIEILIHDGRRAVMAYVSDHGESIPGGSCNKGSANRSTHDAYEVPAFVWLSKSYAEIRPEVVMQLKNNKDHLYTNSVIHQTLLDLMRGQGVSEIPEPNIQSFLRETNSKEKKILPSWNLKFQEAVNINPCAIVLQ